MEDRTHEAVVALTTVFEMSQVALVGAAAAEGIARMGTGTKVG